MKNILLYAHDGVGYGHIARMTNLANVIMKHSDNSQIHFVSGYSNINNFLNKEIKATIINLPPNQKQVISDDINKNKSEKSSETIRYQTLKSIFTTNKYDYIIIDFFPFGTKGELFDILLKIKESNPKSSLILTQRGIAFSKEKTSEFFRDHLGIDFINEVYSMIVCFCDKKIIDINREYFNRMIKIPIYYCGYLFHERLNNLNKNRKINILVDLGGGFECDEILLSIMKVLTNHKFSQKTITILLGEYLKDETKKTVFYKYSKIKHIRFLNAVPRKLIDQLIVDIVIGCGGYNVTIDSIFNHIPIVVIPKDNLQEAFIHSNRLSEFSSIKILPSNNIEFLHDMILTTLNERPYHNLASFGKRELAQMFNVGL